jgi:hypothetical protein
METPSGDADPALKSWNIGAVSHEIFALARARL